MPKACHLAKHLELPASGQLVNKPVLRMRHCIRRIYVSVCQSKCTSSPVVFQNVSLSQCGSLQQETWFCQTGSWNQVNPSYFPQKP